MSATHTSWRERHIIYTPLMYCCAFLGHGPSADIMEGGGSAGVSGHHSGDVDPPEGVAAVWCPDAPRESGLRLVKANCLLESNGGVSTRGAAWASFSSFRTSKPSDNYSTAK